MDNQILTPSEISFLLGNKLHLHEFRRNKRLKKVTEYIYEVIIIRVLHDNNKDVDLVEMRFTDISESNTYRTIVFDKEGNSIKNQDILKNKYVITP